MAHRHHEYTRVFVQEMFLRRKRVQAKFTWSSDLIENHLSVADVVRKVVPDNWRECFLAFYLDIKNKLLGFEVISFGTHFGVGVAIDDIVRSALLCGSRKVIIAHNHPSGDPTPSEQDAELTARVVAAAKLLGIEVLDHVVVTFDEDKLSKDPKTPIRECAAVFSFQANGMIEKMNLDAQSWIDDLVGPHAERVKEQQRRLLVERRRME